MWNRQCKIRTVVSEVSSVGNHVLKHLILILRYKKIMFILTIHRSNEGFPFSSFAMSHLSKQFLINYLSNIHSCLFDIIYTVKYAELHRAKHY